MDVKLALTPRAEYRRKVIKNRKLKKIFIPKTEEVTTERRKLHNEELYV
jgi:hypothetical protein